MLSNIITKKLNKKFQMSSKVEWSQILFKFINWIIFLIGQA